MAQSVRKVILTSPHYIKNCFLFIRVPVISQKTSLRLIYHGELTPFIDLRKLGVPDLCHIKPCIHYLCTSVQSERLVWEGSSRDVLLKKLEIALNNHQVDEAWEAYIDFKRLYGFPDQCLVNKLITELSYSSESKWLKRACNLVFFIQREKSDLLRVDLLSKLVISLSRAQMPVPASMILRLMLDKQRLPPVNILSMVMLHMVKSEIGTYLAANVLVQICDWCIHLSATKTTSTKLIKPDTMLFNLVLDACGRFGSSFKGQQIIELMPRVGVVADAHTIVIIAQIHEMNGRRNELQKFRVCVDQVLVPLAHHYRQFYDSLLNLHFKFDDIDAASALILDMYKCCENLSFREDGMIASKSFVVPIGSSNLRTGLKLQVLPQKMQKDHILKVESKKELVMYKNGKLILSNKALARLIIRYRKHERISELSKLISSIQKKLGSSEECSLCSDMIQACIHMGWLETAHDILEDLELYGIHPGSGSYSSLLTAYYRENMFREAEALLKQISKAGWGMKISNEMVVSTSLKYSKAETSIGKSNLAESVIQEMKEEAKAVPFIVNELNSSIYFFMDAKMIGDALQTYRRMQKTKIQPTVSTFLNLISGYSSLEMYREITILWGDIKRCMENGNLVVNRDLYEFLLLNFLRGGYFERVMEVIGYMKEHGMYTDKLMYRSEYLKFHKDLYRSLRTSNARNEAQSKRLEHVQAFRKWVGID